MIRWALLMLLALSPGATWPAQAHCPAPDDFVIPVGGLPATTAAIGRRDLRILALGGAATLGDPAHGAEFTYPARLAARLTEALPGITVKVQVRATARQSMSEFLRTLDADLAADKPALVIWGAGASAAGRGDDLDTYINTVNLTVAKVRASGADLIMMTLQYAPSVARVINLYPYRMAIVRAGETEGVPVLDRYELMRFWSGGNFLDLDATGAAERIHVARKVYDCMAEFLTKGITDAVK